MSSSQEPDIVIGRVTAPHGIKGEVKVQMETDFPERYESLKEVWLRTSSGQGQMTGIEGVRFHKGSALVKFEGCDDRSCAEDLRGAELLIDRSELKKNSKGTDFMCTISSDLTYIQKRDNTSDK